MILTETLLTSPQAFGIVTATPAQRASCRIRDGQPLGELRDHPDVVAALGGRDAIEALPSERGQRPTEICEVASPRTAKTIRAVAGGLVATQTVDVSRCGPGEIPRVSIVSLKLDVTDVPFRILTGTVEASPLLRPLLISKTTDSALFRHPSGRPIEVACVAGAKAGGSLVSRWSAGVIFDEAPRMQGQEDGIVNLDDARSAVLDRLLPGAQVQYIGSPWAPLGPVYEMVNSYWGKPTQDLVVIRMTGPQGNPSHWTPALCERLQRQDNAAYRVGVLGEFVAPVSGLVSAVSLRRNTRVAPLEIPPGQCGVCAAGIDPSEGSGEGNGFALSIVDRQDGRWRVVLSREWRGGGPDLALREIAAICRQYGIRSASSDQYAGASNVALAARYGLSLVVSRSTGTTNIEVYTNLATLIATDQLEMSPDPILQRDLLGIRKHATPAGWRIELPRSADGRHADKAASLAQALTAMGTVIVREVREERNQRMQEQFAQLPGWGGFFQRPGSQDPFIQAREDRVYKQAKYGPAAWAAAIDGDDEETK
jgi:hypothetical protein